MKWQVLGHQFVIVKDIQNQEFFFFNTDISYFICEVIVNESYF